MQRPGSAFAKSASRSIIETPSKKKKGRHGKTTQTRGQLFLRSLHNGASHLLRPRLCVIKRCLTHTTGLRGCAPMAKELHCRHANQLDEACCEWRR